MIQHLHTITTQHITQEKPKKGPMSLNVQHIIGIDPVTTHVKTFALEDTLAFQRQLTGGKHVELGV